MRKEPEDQTEERACKTPILALETRVRKMFRDNQPRGAFARLPKWPGDPVLIAFRLEITVTGG
jgi:hypothetical protein